MERLEEIMLVIEELRALPDDETIVVEGIRDRDALRSLGIQGSITVLNDGRSIVETCEMMERSTLISRSLPVEIRSMKRTRALVIEE